MSRVQAPRRMRWVACGVFLVLMAAQVFAQPTAELVVQQGQNKLNSVAFSPDVKQLLTAGDDNAVLWDVATGFEIRAFYGHASGVNSAAFSPSGREIVTGSDDGTVRTWEITTGKEGRRIRADGGVQSATYSPDGRSIAAGEWGGEVQIWDAATGQQQASFKAAQSVPARNTFEQQIVLAYSPDGKELLTGAKMVAQLWDPRTGRELQRFTGHTYPIRSVAFSPDGRRVLTGGNDSTARIWDVATGREIRRIDLGRSTPIARVAFYPDGRRVLIGTDHGKLWVWDAETGKQLMVIPKPETAPPIAVTGNTPDERAASFLAADEAEFERKDREAMNAPDSEIVGISFSPDGKLVAIADAEKMFNKGLWIYNAETGEELRAFQGNAAELASDTFSVAFSRDGSHFWTDGPMDWDLTTGIPAFKGDIVGDIFGRDPIAISPDSSRLVIAMNDPEKMQDKLILYDLAAKRGVLQFAPNTGPTEEFRFLGQTVNQPKYPLRKIGQIQFSPDGNLLVTTAHKFNLQDEVRVWNARTGRELCRCALDPKEVGAYSPYSHSVAFSPDSRELLQAGQDKFIHIRNATTCDVISTMDLRDVPARQGNPNDWSVIGYNHDTRYDPLAVVFAPGGRQFLVSTDTGMLDLVDAATRRILWKYDNRGGRPMTVVVFDPAGRRIVTIVQDHLVILDASTGRGLFGMNDALPQVNGLAFMPDGKYLVSSHVDGTIRFWTLPGDRLELVATLFSSQDGHWLVADPVGRFDTDSLDGNALLHWVVSDDPMRPLPLEMFMRQYYTPKLLPLLLAGAKLPPLPGIAQLRRVQPEVHFISATPSRTQPGRVDLVVSAQRVIDNRRQDSGLRDLRVFRNGQMVRYLQGPLNDGNFRIDGVQLSRSRTKVTFSAYAFSDELIKSTTASLDYTYKPAAKATPRAFLLQIGENHYHAVGCELQFSANDANRMSEVLAEKLRARGLDVVAEKLTSTPEHPGATKEDIRQALAQIAARATPDDVFLLSFSGHGYSSPDGVFYILPSSIQGSCRQVSSALLKNAISSDELAAWLLPIDAGEMTFILDSCYSAESVEANGFRPGPMGSRGLGQMAYDKRIRILAASQSDQTAGEYAHLGGQGMGILSYVLSQLGLVEGQADWRPVDGRITTAEWLNFAVHQVPLLDLAKVSMPARAGRGVTAVYQGTPPPVARGQVPAVFDFSLDDSFVLQETTGVAAETQNKQENITPAMDAVPTPPLTTEAPETGSVIGSNMESPALAPLADVRSQADALSKEKKYTEAVPLYQRACTAGNQGACASLGADYYWGNGVVKNVAHAEDLWSKACDAGTSDGCVYLGFLYEQTDGLTGPSKALPYVIKGCDLNEGSSCFVLASDYWTGLAVVPDRSKARQLFHKACSLGVEAGCDPAKWPRQ